MKLASAPVGLLALATCLSPAFAPQAQASSHYSVLYSFCTQPSCGDGAEPASGVTADSAGDLFGTTQIGGKQNDGVVYELIPNSTKTKYRYKRLYSFCARPNCADGSVPLGSLILDTSGDLYGTATGDSVNGAGTIFELSPDGERWRFRLIYRFCPTGAPCVDGSGPGYGALAYQGQASGALYDGASPLYGTTLEGGSANAGVVYEIQNHSGKWKPPHSLHDFCLTTKCPDGQNPYQGVFIDSAGRLYGTANGGGLGQGVLYRIAVNGTRSQEEVLHEFCSAGKPCSDGSIPTATVIANASGDLLGTAQTGGKNDGGVIFQVEPNGTHYNVLRSVCVRADCSDGLQPFAGLVMDPSGNLFGAAREGGVNQAGVVFELSAAGYIALHKFCVEGGNCSNGATPYGTPVLDAKGNLYGTTQNGGAHGQGVVYEITP